MKRIQRVRRLSTVLASGVLLQFAGSCLPEDYFALSARRVAVTLADSLIALAIRPVIETISTGLEDPL